MTNPEHINHIYKIRLPHGDRSGYWGWCRKNLDTNSWHVKWTIVGTSCSYYFKHEEDALAFKLTFGL